MPELDAVQIEALTANAASNAVSQPLLALAEVLDAKIERIEARLPD